MQEFTKFILNHQWIIWLAIVWTIPWKGVALWKAARYKHIIWFVIFLLLNTLALLEIFYIFFVSEKKKENKNLLPKNNNKNGNHNFIKGL